MVRSLLNVSFLIVVLFTSCATGSKSGREKKSKKEEEPVVTQAPPTIYPSTNNTPPPPADNSVFVPYTKELHDRLIGDGIDLRKVQFFIDQKVVLSRFIDSSGTEVKSGIIRFNKGKYINEIIIPAYTPGICELMEDDGLRISFETSGSFIKFLNDPTYSPKFFIVNGANWEKGTAEIPYENSIFRASCAACSSVSEVKLAVKQSDIDKLDRRTRTLQGRKVGGIN